VETVVSYDEGMHEEFMNKWKRYNSKKNVMGKTPPIDIKILKGQKNTSGGTDSSRQNNRSNENKNQPRSAGQMGFIIKKKVLKKEVTDQEQSDRQSEFSKDFAEGLKNIDMGNFRAAIKCFEKALKNNPSNEDTKQYLECALYAELGKMSKKMESIRYRLNALEKSSYEHLALNMSKVPKGLIDSNGLLIHLLTNRNSKSVHFD
jgi:tetratricopeptide (TPR) repeat protein